MSELKPAPRRVQEAADRLRLPVRVVEMAQSTRTAEEAAAACGCDVAQIIKSLVFRGKQSGRPLLLLVSGANRVDQKGVATAIGEALDRPDATFVREVTGFAIGGIPLATPSPYPRGSIGTCSSLRPSGRRRARQRPSSRSIRGGWRR